MSGPTGVPGSQSGYVDCTPAISIHSHGLRTIRATPSSGRHCRAGGGRGGDREYRPLAIVHFAAESHVDRSIDGPAEFLRTNVQGTFCLLEAARHYLAQVPARERGRFRFLHVSTDGVYGSLGPAGRFTENQSLRPEFALFGFEGGGRPFCAGLLPHLRLARAGYELLEKLRPLSVSREAGPADDSECLGRQAAAVYGDGQNVRDWLYVEDHCRAPWRVLTAGRPGETYNIGGDCQQTNADVVRTIAAWSMSSGPNCRMPRARR